jgi:hypothetical protein
VSIDNLWVGSFHRQYQPVPTSKAIESKDYQKIKSKNCIWLGSLWSLVSFLGSGPQGLNRFRLLSLEKEWEAYDITMMPVMLVQICVQM